MSKVSRTPLTEIARRNRQGIVLAKLSRRELFNLGLLTNAGLLIPKSGLSAAASGGAMATFPVGKNPFGLAISFFFGGVNIWVANSGSDSVSRL